MTTLHAPGSFWHGAEIVHVYTRTQALEDGVLIDVTETARQAGWKVPVAVTAGLWADIEKAPPLQDATGRLWDILWVGNRAARNASAATETMLYQLIMPVGRKKNYLVKAVIGPGDDGAPVLTLMRPGED